MKNNPLELIQLLLLRKKYALNTFYKHLKFPEKTCFTVPLNQISWKEESFSLRLICKSPPGIAIKIFSLSLIELNLNKTARATEPDPQDLVSQSTPLSNVLNIILFLSRPQ